MTTGNAIMQLHDIDNIYNLTRRLFYYNLITAIFYKFLMWNSTVRAHAPTSYNTQYNVYNISYRTSKRNMLCALLFY